MPLPPEFDFSQRQSAAISRIAEKIAKDDTPENRGRMEKVSKALRIIFKHCSNWTPEKLEKLKYALHVERTRLLIQDAQEKGLTEVICGFARARHAPIFVGRHTYELSPNLDQKAVETFFERDREAYADPEIQKVLRKIRRAVR